MAKTKSKPKTQAQLDHATDLRLQKTYGVSLAWYDEQLAKQDGGCAICGAPPGTNRLHVDHDHAWKKIKISSLKTGVSWASSATYCRKTYTAGGRTKSEATKRVKVQLKRASVRGLLSYSCNVGLQKFSDRPELFRAAAKYLDRHQNPLIGKEPK